MPVVPDKAAVALDTLLSINVFEPVVTLPAESVSTPPTHTFPVRVTPAVLLIVTLLNTVRPIFWLAGVVLLKLTVIPVLVNVPPLLQLPVTVMVLA